MTVFERGSVVLVTFIFSDESGRKLRPALVISSPAFQRARKEASVAAITSNVRRKLIGDQVLADWKSAGLLFPSTVTGILRTIDRSTIVRRLGALSKADLGAVDREIRRSLGL
jgi:mRNA interferase MazF